MTLLVDLHNQLLSQSRSAPIGCLGFQKKLCAGASSFFLAIRIKLKEHAVAEILCLLPFQLKMKSVEDALVRNFTEKEHR